MKKIFTALLILVFATTTLSGCLERTELNKLGMVSGLGVDKDKDGYTVTAQILNTASLANSSSAPPVYSLKASGKSISDAFAKIDQLTTNTLSLSHLNVIVVNEELAKSGLNPILNFSLRHGDVRPDINILLSKGTSANHILNVLPFVDVAPASELDVTTNMSFTDTARLVDINLYEVIDMIYTNAINLVLNTVEVYHENGDDENTEDDGNTSNTSTITPNAQLRMIELAVFNGEKLIGFLDEYEAQLYNILMGNHKLYVFTTEVDEEYYFVTEVTSTKSKITTDLANNKAHIDIDISAMIVENAYNIDLTTQDNLNVMAELMHKKLNREFKEFIYHMQKDLKSDIIGIGARSFYYEHRVWEEIKGYWEEKFPEVEITFDLNFHIDSVGEIGNISL